MPIRGFEQFTYPERGAFRPGLGATPPERPTGFPFEWPTYGATTQAGQYPTYGGYDIKAPSVSFPTAPGIGAMPAYEEMPLYEPAKPGAYPITEIPTYKPTGEAYPEYREPGAGVVSEELMESIRERMAGRGTAGAESAIYERGEERVERQYEEGLKRIDEQMSARGLTGSGIHGEAVEKLETERQRSLADLSRQITIYGQQAIESSMGRAQQYVEYQSAEAARELATRERGWAGRLTERVRRFESEARAAEAAGRSEEAAYQTATAERIRAYEAQARATTAKNVTSMQKWQAKASVYMQKYQLEMQKAQFLMQAKLNAQQMARDEYWRVYQSKYQATRDEWLAKQAAEEAALKRERFEMEKAELEARRMKQAPGPAMLPGTEWPGEVHGPGWERAFGSTVGGTTGGGPYGGGA